MWSPIPHSNSASRCWTSSTPGGSSFRPANPVEMELDNPREHPWEGRVPPRPAEYQAPTPVEMELDNPREHPGRAELHLGQRSLSTPTLARWNSTIPESASREGRVPPRPPESQHPNLCRDGTRQSQRAPPWEGRVPSGLAGYQGAESVEVELDIPRARTPGSAEFHLGWRGVREQSQSRWNSTFPGCASRVGRVPSRPAECQTSSAQRSYSSASNTLTLTISPGCRVSSVLM